MIPSELNISHLKLNLNICDKIAVFSYQNLKAGVIGQVIPCLVNYFLAPKCFHTIDVQSLDFHVPTKTKVCAVPVYKKKNKLESVLNFYIC